MLKVNAKDAIIVETTIFQGNKNSDKHLENNILIENFEKTCISFLSIQRKSTY